MTTFSGVILIINLVNYHKRISIYWTNAMFILQTQYKPAINRRQIIDAIKFSFHPLLISSNSVASSALNRRALDLFRIAWPCALSRVYAKPIETSNINERFCVIGRYRLHECKLGMTVLDIHVYHYLCQKGNLFPTWGAEREIMPATTILAILTLLNLCF